MNRPAGSRPERRRPSRTPSEASTDTLRWVASTVAKRTATQKRPGAACAISDRSGPRAKAKSPRATTPKGTIWDRPTRDRASMRRSLANSSAASRHMDHRRPECLWVVPLTARGRPGRCPVTCPALQGHHPRRSPFDRTRLVGGDEHRGATDRHLVEHLVEETPRRRRARRGARPTARPPANGRTWRPGPPAAAARPTAARRWDRASRPTRPHRSAAASTRRTSPAAARTANRRFSVTVRSS